MLLSPPAPQPHWSGLSGHHFPPGSGGTVRQHRTARAPATCCTLGSNCRWLRLLVLGEGGCNASAQAGQLAPCRQHLQANSNSNTCATHLQHICNTCATHVQHMCNTCATYVQHMCNICATHVEKERGVVTEPAAKGATEDARQSTIAGQRQNSVVVSACLSHPQAQALWTATDLQGHISLGCRRHAPAGAWMRWMSRRRGQTEQTLPPRLPPPPEHCLAVPQGSPPLACPPSCYCPRPPEQACVPAAVHQRMTDPAAAGSGMEG